ncbi:winged helix-turn-helix domain-containing protein [Kitasatospora sp. NPDC089509]|uniref:winged helix-turn-helix domain-containing protein n=1 Tax=Kitasatospora sp. NPDC089509 TaxID=3364079 RepID=UPI003829EFE3
MRSGRFAAKVIGPPRPAKYFPAVTDEQWQTAFDLTFHAVVRMSRAALPTLRSTAASLVHVTGEAARMPPCPWWTTPPPGRPCCRRTGPSRSSSARVKTLIGPLFRFSYTVEGVWRLLKWHGWSCQQPTLEGGVAFLDARPVGREHLLSVAGTGRVCVIRPRAWPGRAGWRVFPRG